MSFKYISGYGAAAAAIVLAMPAAAQERYFDVPAQDLASAISLFGRQSDLQIVAPADHPAGFRSRAVVGRMDSRAALRRLIAGADLEIASDNGDVIVLRRSTASFPAGSQPESQVDEVDDVVVTGFRGSLLGSQALKREAVGVQDSLVAEDIVDFPDLNLAEALQRIPGVTIDRDASEGRQIALRGLGPDFVRTQLNGVEALFTTSSGLDPRGSISRTRSFDYNVFASELFRQVDVYKTYSASQDEGGIGGTVNLVTPKPFDYDGFQAVVSANGVWNSRSEALSPRLTGLISHSNERFGVLVSASYGEADTVEFGTRLFSWFPVDYGPDNIVPELRARLAPEVLARLTDPDLDPLDKYFHPEGMVLQSWFNHRERLGITSAVQFRPDDRTELTLDMLYGRISNDRVEQAFGTVGQNELYLSIKGTQRLHDIITEGDDIVAASYTGVDFRSEGKVSYDKSEFYQFALRGRREVGERLVLDGVVAVSNSEFEAPKFDKIYLEKKNQAITFDFRDEGLRDGGVAGVFTYGFDPTDPAGWNLQRFSAAEAFLSNEFVTAEANARYEFAEDSALRVGLMYKEFENAGWRREQSGFIDPLDPATPEVVKRVPPYPTLFPYVTGDFDASYDALNRPPVNLNRDPGPDFTRPGTEFTVTEETLAGYLQYDVTTALAGRPFRADLGLRWFRTDVTSEGTANLGGGVMAPVTIKRDYTGVLPAANLAWEVRDNLLLRAAASRNISRPTLSDLRAAGNVVVRLTGGSISAGNPDLEPFKADSVDVSLEWYGRDGDYLSFALFRKEKDSFIVNETAQVPYGQTGYPLEFLQGGQNTADTIFTFTRPVNGEGATINGVELAVHKTFGFLPGPFANFGVAANVTYADSETEYLIDGRTYSLPLLQLSKWTTNSTLYYETERWGARVSHAYRDDYLISTGFEFNVGEGRRATHHVDASAFWNVTGQLRLVLEATDIFEEPIDQYVDVFHDRTHTLTRAGRNIFFGATYRF